MALQRFRAGLHIAVDAQHPRLEGLCRYNIAWAHWRQGDYAAAAAEARQAVDACRRAGTADLASASALLTACQAMRTGDVGDAAQALLDAARGAIGNADLCPVTDLAKEASRLARHAGLPELAAAAHSLDPRAGQALS